MQVAAILRILRDGKREGMILRPTSLSGERFMPGYAIPQVRKPPKIGKHQVQLVANGDLRLSANQVCWPEQAKMEESLRRALADLGYELIRAHPYKESEKHGF